MSSEKYAIFEDDDNEMESNEVPVGALPFDEDELTKKGVYEQTPFRSEVGPLIARDPSVELPVSSDGGVVGVGLGLGLGVFSPVVPPVDPPLSGVGMLPLSPPVASSVLFFFQNCHHGVFEEVREFDASAEVEDVDEELVAKVDPEEIGAEGVPHDDLYPVLEVDVDDNVVEEGANFFEVDLAAVELAVEDRVDDFALLVFAIVGAAEFFFTTFFLTGFFLITLVVTFKDPVVVFC